MGQFMRISRIIDPLSEGAFGKTGTTIADIGRLRPDGADLFLKVGAVDAALGTEAAFISRLVGTAVPAESLRLTGGTEPAGVVGKAWASALFLVGVFLYLLGNGGAVAAQLLTDLAEGSILLKAFGDDQTVLIR